MWAAEHCELECKSRPCGVGHCDRFTIEQENPEWVRVDGSALAKFFASKKELASGTFVSGPLFDILVASREEKQAWTKWSRPGA